MIQSMNREFDEASMTVLTEELDTREELACLWTACAVALNVGCVGQACLVACIGITACPVGAHTL